MGHILGATLEHCPNDPDDRGEFDDAPSAEAITDPASAEGANETACRHGSSDASLLRGVWVVEEVEVLVATCQRRAKSGHVLRVRVEPSRDVHTNPGAHGGDIETEEGSSNSAKGGQDLDGKASAMCGRGRRVHIRRCSKWYTWLRFCPLRRRNSTASWNSWLMRAVCWAYWIQRLLIFGHGTWLHSGCHHSTLSSTSGAAIRPQQRIKIVVTSCLTVGCTCMRANHIQDGSRCGEVGDEMENLEKRGENIHC